MPSALAGRPLFAGAASGRLLVVPPRDSPHGHGDGARPPTLRAHRLRGGAGQHRDLRSKYRAHPGASGPAPSRTAPQTRIRRNPMSAATTQEAIIREALRRVVDPELGCNIVDLGLLYGIAISGSKVTVTMTLTTPGCPMHDSIAWGVQSALLNLQGV